MSHSTANQIRPSVPAEDLKDAVVGALLDTYRDLDQFEQALDIAMTQLHDDRPRLEQELATTDAQIRDATAALDPYLRAFETGSMPDAVCARPGWRKPRWPAAR
ncbi:hypothetical protein BH20ACT9_BH20ACT9_04850 [soil metagenome]